MIGFIRLQLALLALALTQFQLRTKAGTDWLAKVMGDTNSDATGDYAPANYMGLTENDDDPDPEHEALSGEISSGTLVRAQCTFAHTEGASSYTLTRTVTADQKVTLRKIGVFNADFPGGTLVFESRLNAVAQMEVGDTIQITHTVYL